MLPRRLRTIQGDGEGYLPGGGRRNGFKERIVVHKWGGEIRAQVFFDEIKHMLKVGTR